MLAKIRSFFTDEIGGDEQQPMDGDRLNLAIAALMIEVATADESYKEEEFVTLTRVLRESFKLPQNRIDELSQMAREEKESATSLYQFTHLLNDHCPPEQKFKVLHGMWQVAYADGSIDKYEEHMIRKVAELLYIPHADFIRAKLMARDSANAS